MYGAMRERAPNSSRIAGVSVALLMTAAVGYALANGFIGQVAKFIESPLTFTPLAEDPAPTDQPRGDLPVSVDGPAIPPLDIPTDIFVPDDETGGIETPPGDKRGLVGVGPVGGGTGGTASPIRTRPALITLTPPPYPAADI